ncbi:MAG: hypothetical protein ICV85_09630 [Tolypothrix sp. T3-bin4]|nr:hypothetical protein [Tolypothrix sp. Co-bin9]MBD0302417.1 hypothetical protein [Tolypothrix sp. T3-bin4]
MKVKSYYDLNVLIAKSLNWVENKVSDEQQGNIKVWHPPEESEAKSLDWLKKHGVVPDFCRNWGLTEEFILAQCDRENLLVEHDRTPGTIRCTIRKIDSVNLYYPGVMIFTGEGFRYPKSMSFATCIAWLSFKQIEFQIEFQLELNG